MKRSTARRVCALLLCVSLTTPALAAEVQSGGTGYDPGSVTWEELDERIRNGSLTALSLAASSDSIDAIDYDKMYDDLRDALNELASAQWIMSLYGDTATASSLGDSYSSIRDTFDDLKDGELQQDYADVQAQLLDGVNQVVVGGQTLYISILSLERSYDDAQRGLATLDRSLEEIRLRSQLGQVSDQTVAQLEQTRLETVSQISTLESSIRTMKANLQILLGEEATGELELGALPDPADLDLSALDYEADLAAAKEASWTLRSAQITLDDAQEDWKDARSDYQPANYMYTVAEHTWNAAQLTYQSAVESFELSFQTLFRSLADYQQAVESAQSAVEYQQKLLTSAQLQYDRGMISRNSLLSAEDDLAAAQSDLAAAQSDLFTAWHSYEVAVTYGILS